MRNLLRPTNSLLTWICCQKLRPVTLPSSWATRLRKAKKLLQIPWPKHLKDSKYVQCQQSVEPISVLQHILSCTSTNANVYGLFQFMNLLISAFTASQEIQTNMIKLEHFWPSLASCAFFWAEPVTLNVSEIRYFSLIWISKIMIVIQNFGKHFFKLPAYSDASLKELSTDIQIMEDCLVLH